MKIGFLIYSLQGGGAERMVSRLANKISSKERKVSIFIFDETNQAYNLNEDITIYICKTKSYRFKIIRIIDRILTIRKNLKIEKPDVVLAFSMIPYILLASLCLNIRIIGSERTNPNVYSIGKRLEAKFTSLFCSGYIFQTKGAKQWYPEIVRRKSVVIGNIAPELDIKDKKILLDNIKICSVGRLNNEKDFLTILKAFSIFIQKYPAASLDIFGDGDQKKELEKEALNLGIIDKVKFLGFQKNLLEKLQEFQIFIFSSKAEGMPNALLEAMSAGLDCISTDCDFGPKDLIEDGKNGWLVPIGDANMIAERLEWIINHPNKHIIICNNAAQIKDVYSEKAIVEQYLVYINKIIKK
jgi:Glycosyltransferase